MKVNWTRRTVVIAVASSLVGFWLLDGVYLAVSLFGEAESVDPAARLTSTVVVVAFGLVIEQAYMTQSMFADHKADMTRTLKSDIHEQLSTGIGQALSAAGVLAVGSHSHSVAVGDMLIDLTGLLQPVAGLPEPMRSGVATWMREPMNSYRQSLHRVLSSSGVITSLSRHVAVTRAMFDAGSGPYLQINQRAYQVPDEWTRDWCDYLRSTARQGRQVDYVVLAASDDLTAWSDKLDSMWRFLDDVGATLLTCDTALVIDSLGPFTYDFNIEVFDDSVLKTQAFRTPPTGGYRGGVELNMSVMRAEDRPDILALANTVRGCAEVYGG